MIISLCEILEVELLDQMESTFYTYYILPTLPSIILKKTKYCSHEFLQSLRPFFPFSFLRFSSYESLMS